MEAAQPQRIVIIGTSCSGKSTLARALANQLRVPHVELDALYWRPNWTPAPTEEFRGLVAKAAAAAAWVADGNYLKARDILWGRATALVWLNYPFPVVAFRALRRTLRRIMRREVMWAGNRETFRGSFLSRDSILCWVCQTHRRHQREFPLLFEEPAHRHLRVTVLRSPAEAGRFVRGIA